MFYACLTSGTFDSPPQHFVGSDLQQVFAKKVTLAHSHREKVRFGAMVKEQDKWEDTGELFSLPGFSTQAQNLGQGGSFQLEVSARFSLPG